MAQYSIKDIAKLSGVSTATVSRVINNKGKYSNKTKDKVLQVIKKTGYSIDGSAQSLRTNVTHTIGILVPDIKNPFFANLVQKIEEILFKKHYSTFICNTDKSEKKEKAYLQRLENKKVDGIIVISGSGKSGFRFESTIKKIPYICIDREPKDFNDTIFVSSNHYQGALDATNYLIQHGSKHPIFIFNKISTASNDRAQGFKDCLKQNGLNFSKSNNILLFKKDNDFISLFKKHSDIDGIFASNDLLAIQIMQVLKKLRLNIPKQVQIIGFDNIPSDLYVDPTLTTIAQNTKDIAHKAVTNILASINDQGEKGSKILLPTKLIIRNSTK